jgi:hypothetical protein
MDSLKFVVEGFNVEDIKSCISEKMKDVKIIPNDDNSLVDRLSPSDIGFIVVSIELVAAIINIISTIISSMKEKGKPGYVQILIYNKEPIFIESKMSIDEINIIKKKLLPDLNNIKMIKVGSKK